MEGSILDSPVKYISLGSKRSREEVFFPKTSQAESIHVPVDPKSERSPIEFKVLTPLFYDRIVRYAHIAEFLSSEILQQDDKNRTFWTSEPDTLLHVFAEKQKQNLDLNGTVLKQLDWLDRLRWTLLKTLRYSPQKSTLDHTVAGRQSTTMRSDIRRFALSPLDKFVIENCEPTHAREYRRAVSTLLASAYIAFGITELLDALDWLVRFGLCYLSVQTWRRFFPPRGHPPLDGISFTTTVLYCNGLHLWWLFKSFL